ncbi:uncharacterized protein LOC144124290 [Amblyomma americanum]
MRSPLVLVVACILGLSVPLAPAEAKHNEQRELPDAFEIFESFPSAVAISDQDLDGDLDCVKGVRTDFDKESKKATYVWLLKGKNGQAGTNITFHLKPGATPEKADYLLDDSHGPWKTVQYLYSDYKDCVVGDVLYKETEQCMLWVSDQVKHDVPQRCTDKFKDICDFGVMAYDEDSCSGI